LFRLEKESSEGLVALCRYIGRANSGEGEQHGPKNSAGTGTNGLELAMNTCRVELGFSLLDEEGLSGNRDGGPVAELLPSATHAWHELGEPAAGTTGPWGGSGGHVPAKATLRSSVFSAASRQTQLRFIFVESAPLRLQSCSAGSVGFEPEPRQTPKTPMFANSFFPPPLACFWKQRARFR